MRAQNVVELPVWRNQSFGPELADCGGCELREVCAQRFVPAYIGDKYERGGLMLVGEGPGVEEASRREPFVGPTGRLLNALLAAAGLEREQCWITNATLGKPPRTEGKSKPFHDRFPNAIYSCIPRLEAEIAAARPRVIVTLGMPALIALTGYETTREKLVPFDCDGGCDDKRKVGPAIVCATGDCDWYVMMPEELASDEAWCGMAADAQATAQAAWRAALITQHDKRCPKCEAKINRLRPRMMKCPACGGRKTRVEPFTTFGHEYNLIGREGAAGAVFRAAELPARLDTLGVQYIIPTYHPSFCVRPIKDKQKRIGGQYAARAAVAHLEKAKSLLKREAVFDYSVRSTTDPEVVRSWLEERRGRRIACDIETNSEDGPWAVTQITCVGFATADDPEALVVDTRHLRWDPGMVGPQPLLDALHEFFDDEDQQKVWHNGTYDRVVIARLWGLDVYGTVGDTMLLHNACYPDEEHGLGFVAHELTDAPMWKAARKKIPKGCTNQFSGYESFADLADYNAKDDRLTALCDAVLHGDGQHGLLDRDGQRRAYDVDMAMQHIAIEMELRGLPLVPAKLAAIRDDYQAVVDEKLGAMRAIVGDDAFTPTGKALLQALYDPMGPLALPVTKTTEKGTPSTARETLLNHASEPFVQAYLVWKKYTYHLSHYITSDKLAVAEDGRVHPTWKVIGARTGRWSSEPNFQNWPKLMRAAVCAPPGRKIVGADYSQLEARIMAALSGDLELIRRCAEADESDKLNPDKDPHAYVASLAFGSTYVETYRGDFETAARLRDIAKRVVYGLNYGAGSHTVLRAIYDGGYDGPPLSVNLIDRVRDIYFDAFPGVPLWREAQHRACYEARAVRSPILGRHRIFPLQQIDATVIYNFPIQSGAADIMSTRLKVLYDALPSVDPEAFLIAQVHDAVYVECAEARADDVARCIEESLSVELSLAPGAPSMPFVATAKVSDNWKDAA